MTFCLTPVSTFSGIVSCLLWKSRCSKLSLRDLVRLNIFCTQPLCRGIFQTKARAVQVRRQLWQMSENKDVVSSRMVRLLLGGCGVQCCCNPVEMDTAGDFAGEGLQCDPCLSVALCMISLLQINLHLFHDSDVLKSFVIIRSTLPVTPVPPQTRHHRP